MRAHPGKYTSGVLDTIWQQLSKSYFRAPPAAAGPPHPEVVVRGKGQPKRLPAPTEGQPIPAGQNVWISRPDNSIRDVWTSATHHHFVFRDPRQKPRFDAILRERDSLFSALPGRKGNAELSRRLDQLSRWFPRPDLWIVLGLLGLAWRRPRGARTLVAVALAALFVIAFNALGLFADPHFALPVAPAFVLLAAGGLLGTRTRDY